MPRFAAQIRQPVLKPGTPPVRLYQSHRDSPQSRCQLNATLGGVISQALVVNAETDCLDASPELGEAPRMARPYERALRTSPPFSSKESRHRRTQPT